MFGGCGASVWEDEKVLEMGGYTASRVCAMLPACASLKGKCCVLYIFPQFQKEAFLRAL